MRNTECWDNVFMKMATVIAQKSKDPSTQTGAILVSPDKRRMSGGFNGFVAGFPETTELWKRPVKYSYTCHAEINCILNARCDLTGWTLYVTIPCCSDCAKYVAQSGIKRVVYNRSPNKKSQLDYEITNEIFSKMGIEVKGPIEVKL